MKRSASEPGLEYEKIGCRINLNKLRTVRECEFTCCYREVSCL